MSSRDPNQVKIDLEPHLVKPYLKLLTEGCLATENNNEGSERKYIWEYLQQKYSTDIDYRDFLLAIKKFIIDGKMLNNEGFYSMHPAVIEEVKKKTPTPAFRRRGSGENIVLKFLKEKNKNLRLSSKDSKRDETKNQEEIKEVDGRGGSSKRGRSQEISNSGKKQKVKQQKESTRQSKIQKYFMRKQIKTMEDMVAYEKSQKENTKLGFATPVHDQYVDSDEDQESEDEPIVQLRDDEEDNDLQMSQSKLGFHTQQTPIRKSRGRPVKSHLEQSHSQKVQKKSKAITKSNIKNLSKLKEKKKQAKVTKVQPLSQDFLMEENQSTSETQNRHPIHFLTQPVDHIQQSAAKKRGRPVIIEPKVKITKKQLQKNELNSQILKALKDATKLKNIRFRAKKDQDQLSQRVVLKPKTKAIKKVKHHAKIVKPTKMKLRGKTLDLTKLGIINKPRIRIVELKKEIKKQPKIVSRGVTPKKQKRKESVGSLDEPILSQRSDKKLQQSQEKLIYSQKLRIRIPKAKLRKQKSKSKKLSSHVDENGSKVQISNIIYYDRKAKIDATRNLKQLYSMHSHRDGLFIDEKLIYL